jgi:DNA polymerase-3 subunit alpha
LAELLKPYRGGKCPVQLNYRNLIGQGSLLAAEEWCVTLPDDLIANLRDLCGPDKVRVVYG